MIKSVLLAIDATKVKQLAKKLLEELSLSTYCAVDVDDVLRILANHSVDLLLADADFDDVRGFEIARKAVIQQPILKTLVIVDLTSAHFQEALQSHVNGYLVSNLTKLDIFDALNIIESGYRYIAPAILVNLHIPQVSFDKERFKLLTCKERKILELLAQGKTSKQIADSLCLAKVTVDNHKQRMMEKLQLKSRRELSIYYVMTFSKVSGHM